MRFFAAVVSIGRKVLRATWPLLVEIVFQLAWDVFQQIRANQVTATP